MGIPDHLTCLLRNLCAGQEATVRTGHGTVDWFQIGKGVRQSCILSLCLFNLYAEHIMRNARLHASQAGIKTAGRNTDSLRYADGHPPWGLPCGSAGEEPACSAGDLASIPGLGRSPGKGKGYPLQYSGLENSTDCIVHGVAKSWTWLSNFHFHFSQENCFIFQKLLG